MPAAIQPVQDAAGSPAQAVPAAVGDAPLLEPAFSVTTNTPAQFRGIEFHPDGTKAFVHVSEPAIDLWPLAVYYWPELLGGLALLLTLAPLVIAIRRLRRPRPAGFVYCRRCNYNLGTAAAVAVNATPAPEAPEPSVAAAPPMTRCPECGTDTAKASPLPGRSMSRRLALPLAAVLLIGAAYATLHLAGLPRAGWVSSRCTFLSRAAARLDPGRRLRLPEGCEVFADRIAVLNLRSRRLGRTVAHLPGANWNGLTLSHDGAILFISSADRPALAALDATTGRTLGEVRSEVEYIWWEFGGRVSPSPDDPAVVYFRGSLLGHDPRTIWKWRVGGPPPARVFTEADSVVPWILEAEGDAAPLPARTGGRWLRMFTAPEANGAMLVHAELLGEQGERVSTFPLSTRDVQRLVAVVPNPSPFALGRSLDVGSLIPFALPGGSPGVPIVVAAWDFFTTRVIAARASPRFFIADGGKVGGVYDIDAARWVARPHLPKGAEWGLVRISPDGRFVAAGLQDWGFWGSLSLGGGRGGTLYFWELDAGAAPERGAPAAPR